jgi:putative transcriptional regulator
MTGITHHVPEPMLAAYAAGSLGYPFELVVASHVSMCDDCRARLAAHETLGGVVLEVTDPAPVPERVRTGTMAMLDQPAPLRTIARRSGPYPGPVAEALGGHEPRWQSMGLGVRQCLLHEGPSGSVRLLVIPPRQAVPEHSHGGLELTLVLQGSFRDETGQFGVGDLEVADGSIEHVPVAGHEAPCVCLAATDAPLRFSSWLPRLTQRLFRI